MVSLLIEFGNPFWLSLNHMLQQCIVSHIPLAYVVVFFNVWRTTSLDVWDMFICGKYKIPSSLGIRFEFQANHIGVVFSLSVSMSTIDLISFFYASASFSSIRFAKIHFGLSKEVYQGRWVSFFSVWCYVESLWFLCSSAFLILALFNYFKFCLSIICYWNWIFLNTKINF